MKVLWIDPENPKFAVGILDNDNFVHARLKSKGWESFQFFNSLRGAIVRVCKSKANERCTDISDWLFLFDEMLEHFEALLDHTEPQNTMEKPRRRAGKGINSEKMGNAPAIPSADSHPASAEAES